MIYIENTMVTTAKSEIYLGNEGFVSCSYDVRAFDVTISVERYTGKFTKVIIIDPNRPTYTMAFGSCALAQQQF